MAALHGSRGAEGVMGERRERWQAAFRHLFFALRCGLCSAFYLVMPPVRPWLQLMVALLGLGNAALHRGCMGLLICAMMCMHAAPAYF